MSSLPTEPGDPQGHRPGSAPDADITLRRIAEALQGIRFGSVLVVVQDGVVVQIDRTEKTRYGRESRR